jgi:Fis family transcriptional regulator
MRPNTDVKMPPRSAPAAERAAATPQAAAAGADGQGGSVPRSGGETVAQCILRTLDQYFRDLDGARPHQLHVMVMRAVEEPLLRFALERSAGNQSAAAALLGINRNTLRKKLIEHGLAEAPPPRAVVKRANARARKGAAQRRR